MDSVFIIKNSKLILQNKFADFLNNGIPVANIPLIFIKKYEYILTILKSLDVSLIDLIDIIYSYVIDELVWSCAITKQQNIGYTTYEILLHTHTSLINYQQYSCAYCIKIRHYFSQDVTCTIVHQSPFTKYIDDSMAFIENLDHMYDIVKYNMINDFNKYMKIKHNIKKYIASSQNIICDDDYHITTCLDIINHEQFETTIVILKQIIDIIIPLFVKKIESS